MKNPFSRLTLLVAATAVSVSAPDALAGVVDSRYDLQYYLDFCRNKGMFAVGATNIEVFFKDGTATANNTIPLMPNMDSYGQTVSSIIGNKIGSTGGTNLVSSQFVYGAKHVHAKVGNSDVAFLAENGLANCVYDSANLESFGTDSAMQRLTKLVTNVAHTPLADDEFMRTITINDTWLYRLGNGGPWSEGKAISTGENSLGGVVNLSTCWQNTDTGEWFLEGYARRSDNANDWATPLDLGTYFGDSGSPLFAWDENSQQFVFAGALFAGNVNTSFPNWYIFRYSYQQASAVIDKYSVAASFNGTETIQWSASDADSGEGTLTQGTDTVFNYTGKGSGNTLGDSLGLTFSTDDTTTTRELQLQGNVNMGAGALTFERGKWKLSEADGEYTLASAGFEIKKGAELTLELTGTSSEEIRKVGEGTLTIAGSGNNESKLVVGGGTTVYNVLKDENGNITGCTIGNAGETRLDRTSGYAASSVRLEGGVAIVVLMQDNQFKTTTTAGDTFSFGNDGGLLNLNGHDLEWGVINQDGSGTGARIGNFTPLGENEPGKATFTYTGTGTFAGSFMDEGTDGAQLAVGYNNAAEGSTWTLTGNSSNAGGFTAKAGTMKLEGTKTPHVNFSDASDWTYASIETSKVSVQSGATFHLSHHALLSGDVEVAAGGNFVMNQTVNAASESISGSRRQNMADVIESSLIGNVSLNGNASMKVDTTSPVATTMQGNISGDTSSSTFNKTGSGLFVVNGQVSVGTGTIEAGGIIVKDKENFAGTWTIQEAGYLGVEGMNGDTVLSHVSTESAGVLALGANQTTAIENLGNYSNLYIGALGSLGEAVEYGATDLTLAANSEGNWLLGGGGGTLNVNFLLTGANNLIVGNDASGGTVHLTNTGNNFTGDIYIKGSGNMLTYTDGALGSARVALTYGNTLGLNSDDQLSILKNDAQGILALTKSQDLDLSEKTTALGASGDLTYTGTLTVSDKYRFGGSGNLTLDTTLSGAHEMELDGQGNSGSSVTFARENAFTGTITAGGGLHLETANNTGDISIHVGHAETLASVNSMTMQKGATLDTDGRESLIVRNLSAESGATIKNSGNAATLLQLDVSDGTSATIENGVLVDANNNASLSLVKTGTGTLTMGVNSSWSGGLTVMEGAVVASLSSEGQYNSAGGVGAASNAVYVDKNGTLSIKGALRTGRALGGTEIVQRVTGDGIIEFASGGSAFFSSQSSSFEGTIKLTGNTRIYLGSALDYNGSGVGKNTLSAVQNATIEVASGSQVRITSTLYKQSTAHMNSYSDFIISGTGFAGSHGGNDISQLDALTGGALAIDLGSTVHGNVILANDATISSSSFGTLGASNTKSGYGTKGHLGGTIRGKILGEGKTLTFGGNEGMTITADSANTYGDLVIANGNGNNDDKFALRLNNGAAKSQTSTALGTGSVTLNDGLILRLAGTGTADNSNIVYTYENAISAGNNATLQSDNITNRLAGTVMMSGATLNLSTANGGVLELAGGISGSGTLNVGANSEIVLGSASSTMALTRSGTAQFSGNVVTATGADITLMSPAVVSETTTFTGTDSLTLRLSGTEDYTLGGITLTGSEITNDDGTTGTTATALTLNFDFTGSTISSENADSYTTLSSEITANNTNVAIDLNIFEVLAAGTYTLISDFDGSYSLANNTTDNRLSLNISGGNLVLTVAEDANRLLWSGGSASHDWNTSDNNWLKAGTPTAFTENADVILSATGVDSGANSANSRETITLSTAAQTAGTINVLDAYYEIGGNYALTGTALNIGASGDLLLSTDATFGRVTVLDGNLTVNDSSLTGSLSAQDGASVTFENNATLTGDITTNGAASVSVNQSSVTGTISLAESAVLSMDSAMISGEISFDGTGRIIAGTYDGTNVTPADTVISGQFTANSGSMTLSDGAIVLDGTVTLTDFTIADGKTATLWNATETIGQSKNIESLTLGNGASLEINNRISKTSDSAVIGTLTVDNSATIKEVYDAGHLQVSTLNMAEGQSSATLTLTKDSKNTNAAYTSVFDFGSATTEAGNFVGNVVLNNTNSSSTKHSAFINLYNAKIFANTVVTMGTQNSSAGYLGLGISTNGVQIAGLESQESYGNRALLFSGYAPTDIGWNTGDGPNKNNDEVARTLTINTTSGKSYTYYGQVREQLSLIKSGEGRQAFYGNSGDFNGSISVEAGTLAFNAAGSSMLSGASALSVSGGAILDLSAITFGSGEDTTETIALSSGAEFSFDADAVIAFGDMKTGITYNVFDATNGTLSGWNTENLDAENFTINGIVASEFGHTVHVELGVNGTINFNAEHYNLVWSGGESGTWNRETTNASWKQVIGDSVSETTTYFANYDNVAFNGNANVTITEALKVGAMTIADGTAVALTETGTLTAESIAVGNGATLTFVTEKAGYTAANISGAGTVVLDLTNNHGNQLKLGSEFAGETHLSSGYFTITGAQVGSKLTLEGGTEFQTTDTAGTTVTADIVLKGTTGVHANSDKAVIYSKSVTGGTYLSKGSSSHTFNGTVDLTAFNTENVATVNFNAETDIDTLTVDAVNNGNVGVTVNANGTTTIGTFAISNNTTANFADTTTIATANLSGGTVNFNGETTITTTNISGGTANFIGTTTLHALNATGGTVNASGHLTKVGTEAWSISGTATLNSVDIQEGSLGFTNGENARKSVGTLTLGNAVVFSTRQDVSPSEATVVNALNLSGATATVRIGNAEAGTDSKWGNSHQGYLQFEELGLSGVESGTLNLVANHNSSLRTIFELGNSSASSASAGTFKGEINIAVNNSGNRSASLVISDATIAQNARINLETNKGASGVLSLGVNADKITIAGLSSTLGTANAKVYSGKIGVQSQTSDGYADSSIENGTSRTLEINVAENANYSYNGEILANLMLVKTGTGTQTLAGANTSFNGGISVEAGTLIAEHANALGTGAISVESGAVLQANAAITLSAASQSLTLVVGEAQVASSTYNLRNADATGTALITKGSTESSGITVSEDTVVYVDVSALTGTQGLLSGDSISLRLATGSALNFNDANAKIGWWDDSCSSWTDWSVVNNYTYDNTSGLLTISIPEPSTFGLLAGASALSVCVSRRRRRK